MLSSISTLNETVGLSNCMNEKLIVYLHFQVTDGMASNTTIWLENMLL